MYMLAPPPCVLHGAFGVCVSGFVDGGDAIVKRTTCGAVRLMLWMPYAIARRSTARAAGEEGCAYEQEERAWFGDEG